MNGKNIISLERLLINGPVVESYEDINNSIYEDIYKSAKRQTENIINTNREYNRECRKGKKYTFEGSNVISFVGRRGTGKTSAMLSFSELLAEYTRAGEYSPAKCFFENQDLMKNIRFYSLDIVDASTLDESEDIFLIVLSNMFNQAETIGKDALSKISEFDNRQLFQKFEKVYNDFVTLSQNMKDEDEYAAFEKMRKISGSQKIRESFADLVREFLRVNTGIYSEGYENGSSYLVIMVDDLDMTYDNTGLATYKVMNTIYKYMRVPNVIVLTTYNDQKLLNQCNDYFIHGKDFFLKQNPQFYVEQQQNIAVEFIEKVIPVFARVYMPSWKKKDFENNIKIYTDLGGFELPTFMKNQDFLIKKFLFLLLAERTGIYFDIQGKKHHFYEPETLRELYNRVQFLLGLNKQESSDQLDGVIKYNLKKIKEDCYFRFKEEKLTEINERYFFESLLEEPIERRGEKLIRQICFGIEKLGKRAKRRMKQSGVDTYLDNHLVPYSYAEMIHGIYHLTRNAPENGNMGSSKYFVSVLLYSYTIQLTDIYARYKNYKKSIGKNVHQSIFRNSKMEDKINDYDVIQFKKMYNILKNVIGYGVCCQWAEYFFPEVELKNFASSPAGLLRPSKSGPYITGYIENDEKNKLNGVVVSLALDYFSYEFINEFCERLQPLLLEAMMFTDALDWTKDNVKWDIGKLVSGNKIEGVSLKLCISEGDFDVTGIFKYTFCYGEFLGKMECIMLEALEDYKKIDNQIYENMKPLLQNVFSSLWEKYEDWDSEYGNMMLPLYSLDVTYNIIKRVFQESSIEKRETLLLDDIKEENEIKDKFCIIREYKIMLDHLKKHLQLLDEGYAVSTEKNGLKMCPDFSNAFIQCPVYQFIEKNIANDNVATELYLFFYRIVLIQQMIEGDFIPPQG